MKLHLIIALGVVTLGFFGVANAAEKPIALPNIDSQIIFFYYKDVDEVTPFYERTLGLTKTFDLGWVKIYRITPTSYVGLTSENRGFHKTSLNKPAMLSIVTDDVDGWYDRLSQSGANIVSKLKPMTATPAADRAPVRGFIVEDPGGYTVEFFTWL